MGVLVFLAFFSFSLVAIGLFKRLIDRDMAVMSLESSMTASYLELPERVKKVRAALMFRGHHLSKRLRRDVEVWLAEQEINQ